MKVEKYQHKKRIMIFLEGTVFYTKPILFLFMIRGYKPIGEAISIINGWKQQGAEIVVCTYAKKRRIPFIQSILKHYKLDYDKLCYRKKGQTYADLVEEIRPDVLIEDDCASIGGEKQMCITNTKTEIKETIHSIVVNEFMGIDGLKRNLEELLERK